MKRAVRAIVLVIMLILAVASLVLAGDGNEQGSNPGGGQSQGGQGSPGNDAPSNGWQGNQQGTDNGAWQY